MENCSITGKSTASSMQKFSIGPGWQQQTDRRCLAHVARDRASRVHACPVRDALAGLHDEALVGRMHIHGRIKLLRPVRHARVKVRVRHRNGPDAAQATDVRARVIVQHRDAVPQDVALACENGRMGLGNLTGIDMLPGQSIRGTGVACTSQHQFTCCGTIMNPWACAALVL